MRRCLLCTASLLLFTLLNAETIYLKSGDIIKGAIIDENEVSIFVEMQNKWKRIPRSDVEMISGRDSVSFTAAAEPENAPADDRAENTEPEAILKLSVDFPGKHEVSGTLSMSGYGTGRVSGSADVDMGFSIGGEGVFYPGTNCGLGFGINCQIPRKQKNITGRFNFIPVYGLVKLRATPSDEGRYCYAVGHLGYNFFSGDKDYTGPNGNLTGGLYYAIGGGVNLKPVIFEILYAVHRGTVKDSGTTYYGGAYRSYDLSGDITYSKASFSIGVQFN